MVVKSVCVEGMLVSVKWRVGAQWSVILVRVLGCLQCTKVAAGTLGVAAGCLAGRTCAVGLQHGHARRGWVCDKCVVRGVRQCPAGL